MTLIIPAYKEAEVIADKVANARALDYPGLTIVVAVDGGDEATVRGAEAADVVLELPRGGKIRAQDAAVRQATTEIVAFSDANAMWDRQALRGL